MKPLSEAFVEKSWQEAASLSPDRADREMRAMGRNQPDLLAFLMAFTEELGQDVRELAVYLGFVVYRMFLGSGGTVPRITSRAIMAVYNKNARMLKGLEGTDAEVIGKTARGESSSQPHVVKYVLEALMEVAEDDAIELGGEAVALLFVLLKTEIEVLDRSSSLSRSSRRPL